jgi:hypothetical protein
MSVNRICPVKIARRPSTHTASTTAMKTGAVLGKLGVSSRDEAIALGRAGGLDSDGH